MLPADRPALTRLLSAQGLTVHVHATAGDRDAGALWTAVAVAHPSSIDVHMIGSEASVDNILAEVLAARPGRVFLSWSTFTDRRADVIRGADVRAWITLWDEWDGMSALDGRRIPTACWSCSHKLERTTAARSSGK